MGIRFGVLGPVAVWDEGRPVPVGGPQQRGLLALLLLNANRVVSVDRLVDHLWGDQPPATARGLLQGCVAGVRRALRRAGGGEGRLETIAPGYRLRVTPGELDLDRFEQLAEEASNTPDPVRAAELLAEALAWWRGPALDGIDLASCQGEAARLAERRLTVLEQRIDIDLHLGRGSGLVGELQVLAKAHPLRERLRAQLMLALQAADRQADALDAYQQLRRTLVNELGVEPSATLQHLHRTILAGEDALIDYLRARGLPAQRPGPPPARSELPTTPPERPESAVPAQLPAAPAGFAGRADALKRLDELLADTGRGLRVAMLSGMAGIGKTALAVHWAHRVRQLFAHGQLYVNLRGYAPPPMRPIDALAGFLQALGVPADRVPVDPEQAAALYRSLLADRQVLVVLDNAYSIEQVRPLLPGGPGCLVLVTGRELLAGLVAREGAVHMDLDVLDPDEAHELLARVLGEQRVAAEAQAAVELARWCAFLPLALRIAAANLAVHPRRRIADQVSDLDTGDRLTALTVGQDEQAAVRTAFDQSYATLPADARRLFRLLGLVPGPHVTAEAAGALAGSTPERTARLLDRLVGGHLIDRPAPGRYALHDLVRLYAADRVNHEDTVDDRRGATGRLYDWYLRTAYTAAQLLYPDASRLPLPDSIVDSPARFDRHQDALAWLEAERSNLLAVAQHTAERGPHPVAYRLASALNGFYIMQPHPVEWLAIVGAGLAAARADQDLPAEAHMELNLGNAWLDQSWLDRSRHRAAVEHYQRALALSERSGSTYHVGAALNGLGNAYQRRSRLAEARETYQRALALNRRHGLLTGQATNLGNLGLVQHRLGHLREAADLAAEALARFRELGARGKEAQSLGILGEVQHQLGRLEDAEQYLASALTLGSEVGDQNNRADYQRALAAVHRDAGRHRQALTLAQEALATARLTAPRNLAEVLTTLGTVHHDLGRHRAALRHHNQAFRLARSAEIQWTAAAALIGMAAAQHRLGLPEAATAAAQEALAIARDGGYRVREGDALATLAAVDLASGRLDEAVGHAEQAITVHGATGHRLGEARALRELGHALHRRGDTGVAAASLRRAHEMFTEIGSPDTDF